MCPSFIFALTHKDVGIHFQVFGTQDIVAVEKEMSSSSLDYIVSGQHCLNPLVYLSLECSINSKCL